jgi:hypothetical protein
MALRVVTPFGTGRNHHIKLPDVSNRTTTPGAGISRERSCPSDPEPWHPVVQPHRVWTLKRSTVLNPQASWRSLRVVGYSYFFLRGAVDSHHVRSAEKTKCRHIANYGGLRSSGSKGNGCSYAAVLGEFRVCHRQPLYTARIDEFPYKSQCGDAVRSHTLGTFAWLQMLCFGYKPFLDGHQSVTRVG